MQKSQTISYCTSAPLYTEMAMGEFIIQLQKNSNYTLNKLLGILLQWGTPVTQFQPTEAKLPSQLTSQSQPSLCRGPNSNTGICPGA